MKKIKGDQTANTRELACENKIPSKVKSGSAGKKTILFPEEFEEDRSMNIRMTPQPLAESVKKSMAKK